MAVVLTDGVVARRYAEALVNALESNHRIEAGLKELEWVAGVYSGSKDLERFLGSPGIAEEEKRRLLNRFLNDTIGPEVMSLIHLLLRWDRIEHLPAVADQAKDVAEIRQGVAHGTVTTAHPISSVETEKLAQAAGSLLKKRVILKRQVDAGLLGGVRISIGTVLLDGSVQSRLKELREELKAAKVAS